MLGLSSKLTVSRFFSFPLRLLTENRKHSFASAPAVFGIIFLHVLPNSLTHLHFRSTLIAVRRLQFMIRAPRMLPLYLQTVFSPYFWVNWRSASAPSTCLQVRPEVEMKGLGISLNSVSKHCFTASSKYSGSSPLSSYSGQ